MDPSVQLEFLKTELVRRQVESLCGLIAAQVALAASQGVEDVIIQRYLSTLRSMAMTRPATKAVRP